MRGRLLRRLRLRWHSRRPPGPRSDPRGLERRPATEPAGYARVQRAGTRRPRSSGPCISFGGISAARACRCSAGGTRAHLRLPQADRAHVLLAAKHELGFLLALHLVSPRRQHRAHQHRHHREGDEQRRHRVAPRASGLTLKRMRVLWLGFTMLPQPARRNVRGPGSLLAVLAGLSVTLSSLSCEKVPLLAPTGSVITLLRLPPPSPSNGSMEIVATVIEQGTASPTDSRHARDAPARRPRFFFIFFHQARALPCTTAQWSRLRRQ